MSQTFPPWQPAASAASAAAEETPQANRLHYTPAMKLQLMCICVSNRERYVVDDYEDLDSFWEYITSLFKKMTNQKADLDIDVRAEVSAMVNERKAALGGRIPEAPVALERLEQVVDAWIRVCERQKVIVEVLKDNLLKTLSKKRDFRAVLEERGLATLEDIAQKKKPRVRRGAKKRNAESIGDNAMITLAGPAGETPPTRPSPPPPPPLPPSSGSSPASSLPPSTRLSSTPHLPPSSGPSSRPHLPPSTRPSSTPRLPLSSAPYSTPPLPSSSGPFPGPYSASPLPFSFGPFPGPFPGPYSTPPLPASFGPFPGPYSAPPLSSSSGPFPGPYSEIPLSPSSGPFPGPFPGPYSGIPLPPSSEPFPGPYSGIPLSSSSGPFPGLYSASPLPPSLGFYSETPSTPLALTTFSTGAAKVTPSGSTKQTITTPPESISALASDVAQLKAQMARCQQLLQQLINDKLT